MNTNQYKCTRWKKQVFFLPVVEISMENSWEYLFMYRYDYAVNLPVKRLDRQRINQYE